MNKKITVLETINKYNLIGYQEKGGNDNKFGQYFGWNGVSWCALFVSYVLEFSKNPMLYHLKDKSGKLRAGCYERCAIYCPTIEQHFKELGKLRLTDPKPNDIVLFCWDKVNSPEADHIGFVESYDPQTGYLTTIEGNTSSGLHGSQDNGDGVYRKKRHFSLTCGFVSTLT